MDDAMNEWTHPRAADYIKGMQVNSTDLDPITSIESSYNDAKPIFRAVRQNLIHIASDQDPVNGCLYIIKKTTPSGTNHIALTANPGKAPVQGEAKQDGQMKHRNDMNEWICEMDTYTLEQEVTKAMITWLLELIPEDMIRKHHNPEYKYRKVTLELFTTHVWQHLKQNPKISSK